MTNGQKNFYKFMHVLSIISIIGILLGFVTLVGIWILKPIGGNTSYGLDLGVLSFDFSQEMLGNDFFFSDTFFITLLGTLLIAAFLLVNVKSFFKNLISNNIFLYSNANAIRNVGLIVILMSFFNNIPAIIAVNDISKNIDLSNVPYAINYEIEYGLLFAGLAILAVGQIFKKAVKVAEENELTI